jgi:two-component system sensor histidine kinase KdpD
VVNRLRETLESRKVSISIDPPFPLCRLDYGLMEQALHNLIINAHLYTPAECTIFIHAKFVEGRLMLTIEDNGGGFPSNEIGKVFEKFYRLKTSQTGGTGLGLSIVKGCVEAHHGTVALRNRDSGGAQFTIGIPTESTSLSSLKNE